MSDEPFKLEGLPEILRSRILDEGIKRAKDEAAREKRTAHAYNAAGTKRGVFHQAFAFITAIQDPRLDDLPVEQDTRLARRNWARSHRRKPNGRGFRIGRLAVDHRSKGFPNHAAA